MYVPLLCATLYIQVDVDMSPVETQHENKSKEFRTQFITISVPASTTLLGLTTK